VAVRLYLSLSPWISLPQLCYRTATALLPDRHSFVTGLSQLCYRTVTALLPDRHSFVTGLSQLCYRTATALLPDCHSFSSRANELTMKCYFSYYPKFIQNCFILKIRLVININSISTDLRRTVLENLIVAQHVRNSPPFMEPKVSLSCSQDSVTEPYPEPDEFSPHPHTYLDPFLIILYSHLLLRLQSDHFFSGLTTKIPHFFFISYALIR
jgi:hypothetical protein